MKMPIVLVCVAICMAAVRAAAAEPAAAPAKLPPAADVKTELQTLVQKTKAKIESGARTGATLADELKAFDALLAAHATEKTEQVAEVLFIKAALYLQVIGDLDKGSALLVQVKTDYPGTAPARASEEALTQIEQQKESMRLQASLQPGAVFPDFQERDLNGQPLSVSQFKGKVVLVDFWATWCGPCVAELPNVLSAYQKYHDKGFEIVGISLDRSEDALKTFLKEKGMTWPQFFDGKAWESKLGRRYGVSSIPATYLLDQEGRIVARDLRGEALENQLAKLLAK